MYTKSLSKFGIHFVYIPFVYSFYKSVLIHKNCTSKILRAICMQNSYRMYIQIIACKDPTFQHILTRLLCTS